MANQTKLYTGTYIYFYNGNGAEFLKTIVTTFVCKSRRELESTMFTYIIEDFEEFTDNYCDENSDQFESYEGLCDHL